MQKPLPACQEEKRDPAEKTVKCGSKTPRNQAQSECERGDFLRGGRVSRDLDRSVMLVIAGALRNRSQFKFALQLHETVYNAYMPQAIKAVLLTAFLSLFAAAGWCADDYVEKAPPHKHCPLTGSGQRGTKKVKQDAYKNRWHPPLGSDFDSAVTIQALVQPGNDRTRWSNQHAARIRGYVAEVKQGTLGESCNCGANAPIDSDTHIAVVADSTTAQDKRTHVIVEVTPRLREAMAAQNPSVDWGTDALKKRLQGKHVEFEGWLFFDSSHTSEAMNTHPQDPKQNNWRATCWEIHPVTAIQVLDIL